MVYAYGCGYEAACVSGGGTAPDYFFAPDGTYDIYDYRNPGELRINAEAEGLINGHLKTGPITHDLTAGGVLFLRSVQQPGAPPGGAPDWVADGAVYGYIGSENIYSPNAAFKGATDNNGVRLQAGPRALWEDNHQTAAVMQDRMHLPGRIQLLAGGRYDSLRDHNYSAGINTDKPVWLPQYAVTFNPVDSVTVYGNYGVLLSLGPQAPWWVDNGSQFLSPFMTRQAEIGVKFEPGQRILVTAALFRMRAPFFYPEVIQAADSFCPASVFYGPGDVCFESDGHETHNGIELNAEGKAASWLRLSASAATIRAQSSDTGTPAFNNKQVLNVPHLRTALFADLTVPHSHGLHLMPGWSYSGRKEATRDDTVSVPAYNLFNLGARYTPGGEQGRVTLRLYADNIADKRYWKDTGASYGDTFIHLGAPTTVRLSAHYTF